MSAALQTHTWVFEKYVSLVFPTRLMIQRATTKTNTPQKYSLIISSGEADVVWEHYHQTAKGKMCSMWLQVQSTKRTEKPLLFFCMFCICNTRLLRLQKSFWAVTWSENLIRPCRPNTESTDTGISVGVRRKDKDDTAVFPPFQPYLCICSSFLWLFFFFFWTHGIFPQPWRSLLLAIRAARKFNALLKGMWMVILASVESLTHPVYMLHFFPSIMMETGPEVQFTGCSEKTVNMRFRRVT